MASTNLQSIKLKFGIIGNSKALDAALDTAVRVANTDLSVLITGESGVGKEAFSKIIHSLSSRKHNNFIAVNCGAIPEGTINSELFGHEKGAFTGATDARKGYFETVDGGTIFLDEIGEMPLDTQAYLLRILESGEFIRVGSSKVQSTDVRIIAATNVDLFENINKGKFREDLYYRLNTVPIRIPALKERIDDIPLLFRKFAIDFSEKYKTPNLQLEEQAVRLLQSYQWPGNIRELRNLVGQMSILSEDKMISAEDVLHFIPSLTKRNLPLGPLGSEGEKTTFQEREILYKLLFDMKHDLNELKSLIFELIRNNNLRVPDMSLLRQLQGPSYPVQEKNNDFNSVDHQSFIESDQFDDFNADQNSKPFIVTSPNDKSFSNMEVVEENLSIEEMEKELILKALKKHGNRRKEAADDLGISERTLYRKIKQYDL
jgi:transcriptional regulator with PAS, ATPase and Fis domain